MHQVDELRGYLLELTSGDDLRAEAAATGIAALPAAWLEDALAELQALLASPDVEARWWAARALAAITDERVAALLAQALGDVDASVRQCAALGLRLHPDPQAAPALALALGDGDPLVARLAADALIGIGAAAVPLLLDILQNAPHLARLQAARALACIGDQRAIPALFAALDEDSALIEYWAAEGLERMGVGMMFFIPE